MIRRTLGVFLLVLLLAACDGAITEARESATALPAGASPTVATAPLERTVPPQPTQALAADPTATIPTGDSRVARQRELLFARLDLEGEGAGLRPAEPVIPSVEFGAIEVYAFEQADPYLYYAFYLFESDATLTPAFTRWVMDDEALAYLPEGAKLIAGSGNGNISISYYFADGSRGDPDTALDALYEVTSRVGGDE